MGKVHEALLPGGGALPPRRHAERGDPAADRVGAPGGRRAAGRLAPAHDRGGGRGCARRLGAQDGVRRPGPDAARSRRRGRDDHRQRRPVDPGRTGQGTGRRPRARPGAPAAAHLRGGPPRVAQGDPGGGVPARRQARRRQLRAGRAPGVLAGAAGVAAARARGRGSAHRPAVRTQLGHGHQGVRGRRRTVRDRALFPAAPRPLGTGAPRAAVGRGGGDRRPGGVGLRAGPVRRGRAAGPGRPGGRRRERLPELPTGAGRGRACGPRRPRPRTGGRRLRTPPAPVALPYPLPLSIPAQVSAVGGDGA